MQMLVPERKTYYKKKLLNLLDVIESISEPAVTVYLPEGFDVSDLIKVHGLLPENQNIPEQVFIFAAESRTSAVLFWGENKKYLIIPPFPLPDRQSVFGYEVEGLRQLINKSFTIAVVFIRLGLYGIGLFKGDVLESSKVGTGLVHGRHKKGGSSQHRFERHRDKQMEYFFTNVCEKSREKLEPYARQIDYLFYCGERMTVINFVKQCKFMQSLEDRVMPRLINVRGHGQQALTEAINKIWSCEVIEWHYRDESDAGK
jgi:hypothetical protein